MTVIRDDEARRGRREEALDAALPAHRAAFATRLRELRRECGQPTYRTLSGLAHCGSGSLSEAASGRRLPTWETTRGYVSGCLRHAGRAGELGAVLPVWRHAWEEATLLERAHRAPPAPQAAPPRPAPQAAPPRPAPQAAPPRAHRLPAVLAVVTVLMATMVAAVGTPREVTAMTGLYNVLVVPFAEPAAAVQHAVVRELTAWAGRDDTVAVRGPATIRRATGDDELGRLARAHHADVVVTGEARTAGDDWTITIDLLLTDRVFAETPEFVGHHELSMAAPADLVRGNIELHRRLADDTLRYIRSVVSFVSGLGHYALGRYAPAEWEFRAAAEGITGRREVVRLMLGNAIGRGSGKRYDEAAAAFRLALAERPDYPRATVGLAEALRAGASCDLTGVQALRQSLRRYDEALQARAGALLEMKARLGRGLAYQCLAVAGTQPPTWAEADVEFARVLGREATAELTGGAGRHGLRLAAEARAGQALTGYLTADGRFGRYVEAARAYQDALGLLARSHPATREREVVFLRNLRNVYRAMETPESVRAVDERIRAAGGGS
jgi:tetratricopeptide (TPR) repeat protein